MSFNIIYTVASFAVTIAALILIGVKFKKDDEKYFPLYIFLYYFISASKLIIVQFPVPLGLIICFLYLENHKTVKNRRAKQLSMILGLVMFILSSVVPYIHYSILSSPKIISVSSWNTKSFNFTKEYEAVLKSLGSEALEGGSPKTNLMEFEVDKNNNINKLYYCLVFPGNTYQSADIQELLGENGYMLYVYPKLKDQSSSSLLEGMGMTGNSNTPDIDAASFFKKLDTVGINKLKFSGASTNYFTLWNTLKNSNQQAEVYTIEGSSIKIAEDKGQTGNILICSNNEDSKNYLF